MYSTSVKSKTACSQLSPLFSLILMCASVVSDSLTNASWNEI